MRPGELKLPLSACSSPARIRSRVVLPRTDGPVMAVTPGDRRLIVMRSSTGLSPKRLLSAQISIGIRFTSPRQCAGCRAIQQSHEHIFNADAEQNDCQRPGKQIGRFQIDLGIIQIAGLFGYEFDTTITTAFAYTMLLTAVMFLSMTTLSYYKAENKKISLAEGMRSANKTLSCYYWVFSLVIAVVCIVLSVIAGSAFVIKLVPIAIASIICALTATKVAPAFWLMFLQKTEESAKSGK